MHKVVTMGEMMARFMPAGNQRIEQASSFHVFYGGDESIVAASLARFGLQSTYLTRVPDNPLGRAACQHLRAQGVNTSSIVFGGDRLGLNFYENGAAIRPSTVLYDRKSSSISEAEPSMFDLESIFRDADWFHVSGITPALSDKARVLTETALRTAHEMGLRVSVDLNYRRKLWSEEEARRVMTSLMQYVDVCIGNEEDASITLGYKPKGTDVYKGSLDIEGYKDVFQQLKEKFGFRIVASTLRESFSASDNGWSALVYDGNSFCQSRKYEIHLVDRGGGGASFSAGLIFGLLTGMTLQETTEFAAAASALKQTIVGDFNLVSVDEVKQLMAGDVSGRVQR